MGYYVRTKLWTFSGAPQGPGSVLQSNNPISRVDKDNVTWALEMITNEYKLFQYRYGFYRMPVVDIYRVTLSEPYLPHRVARMHSARSSRFLPCHRYSLTLSSGILTRFIGAAAEVLSCFYLSSVLLHDGR